MITASQFVTSHGSFWDHCFPALESYVRVVNSGAYDRFAEEMDWPVLPARSALISEVAFCILGKGKSDEAVQEAYMNARNRLNGLPGVIDDGIGLNDAEKKTVLGLSERIGSVVTGLNLSRHKVILEPAFAGCGLLSQSYGDIAFDGVLIELKNVDRGFRASDFRQLMTYVFQCAAEGAKDINMICVANARKGIIHKAKLDQFIYDTSASSFVEIHSKFFASVGLGGISR